MGDKLTILHMVSIKKWKQYVTLKDIPEIEMEESDLHYANRWKTTKCLAKTVTLQKLSDGTVVILTIFWKRLISYLAI